MTSADAVAVAAVLVALLLVWIALWLDRCSYCGRVALLPRHVRTVALWRRPICRTCARELVRAGKLHEAQP